MSVIFTSAVTGAPAFETTTPATRTRPARIKARARSRDAARPRATIAWSSRVASFFIHFADDLFSIRSVRDPPRDRRELPAERLARQRRDRAFDALRRHVPRDGEPEQ